MTPIALMRAASAAGISLNVRGGELYAVLPPDPPGELVATIKAHKPAIIAALQVFATSSGRRELTCTRADVGTLTPAGRRDAEALATELAHTGGLGQFVGDLLHMWHDLDPADRAAACHVWRLVAGVAYVVACDNLACLMLGPCETYLRSGACAFLPTTAARAA